MYKINKNNLKKIINLDNVLQENQIFQNDFISNFDKNNKVHENVIRLIYNPEKINLTLNTEYPYYNKIEDLIASILLDEYICQIDDINLLKKLEAVEINANKKDQSEINWTELLNYKQDNSLMSKEELLTSIQNYNGSEKERKKLIRNFDFMSDDFFNDSDFLKSLSNVLEQKTKNFTTNMHFLLVNNFIFNKNLYENVLLNRNFYLLTMYVKKYQNYLNDVEKTESERRFFKYYEKTFDINNYIEELEENITNNNYLTKNEIIKLFEKNKLQEGSYFNIKKFIIKNESKIETVLNICNEKNLESSDFIKCLVKQMVDFKNNGLPRYLDEDENICEKLSLINEKITDVNDYELFIKNYGYYLFKFEPNFHEKINESFKNNINILENLIKINYKIYHQLDKSFKLNKSLFFSYLSSTNVYNKKPIINYNQIPKEIYQSLSIHDWQNCISLNREIIKLDFFKEKILTNNQFLILCYDSWKIFSISEEKEKEILSDFNNVEVLIQKQPRIFLQSSIPLKLKVNPYLASIFFAKINDSIHQKKIIEYFCENEEFFLLIIKDNYRNLEYIPEKLKNRKEFVFKVLDVLEKNNNIDKLNNYNIIPKEILQVENFNKDYIKNLILNIKIENAFKKKTIKKNLNKI